MPRVSIACAVALAVLCGRSLAIRQEDFEDDFDLDAELEKEELEKAELEKATEASLESERTLNEVTAATKKTLEEDLLDFLRKCPDFALLGGSEQDSQYVTLNEGDTHSDATLMEVPPLMDDKGGNCDISSAEATKEQWQKVGMSGDAVDAILQKYGEVSIEFRCSVSCGNLDSKFRGKGEQQIFDLIGKTMKQRLQKQWPGASYEDQIKVIEKIIPKVIFDCTAKDARVLTWTKDTDGLRFVLKVKDHCIKHYVEKGVEHGHAENLCWP